jgi:hypothetical protein
MAIGSLSQHAERQLSLVLLAASGHDGRYLAAVRHGVLEGGELLGPAPHRLGDSLAAPSTSGPMSLMTRL